MILTGALFALLAPLSLAGGIRQRQSPAGTASVRLAETTGEAKFLASGFIYGWPDNGTEPDTSIPENLVREINFNANRAGGAQTPDKGWAYGGYDAYYPRFESTLSNYRTTRKYGGDFIMLLHDMWGADGGTQPSTLHPGDDGDWTETDLFLRQLSDDIRANDMLEGLVLDLWNEPELAGFWSREFSQYIDYYVHATAFFRTEFPDTLISGPSGAHRPTVDSETWRPWLAAVAENDAVPDLYSWHQIGAWEGEPDTSVPTLQALLTEYGLPERPIDINEYAWPDEQNPSNSAWYMAQLERHNLRGLRANWGSGGELHNYMADLVFPDGDGSYHPNGEWVLYKYYAGMTGQRAATTASDDGSFDVFATTSEDGVVKVLAGTRTVQAAYDISISGLAEAGFPDSGSVEVRTWQFTWPGRKAEVTEPIDLGTSTETYSDGTLTLHFNPADNSTAFAYEFSRP